MAWFIVDKGGRPMEKGNSSEENPAVKPEENADDFQDYIKKLRESGLKVIDTTKPGAATIFVGGVRKQPKH
jgi:hypothetical protein